jgi:transglutaminase-like putative cysteine protease
MILSFMTEKSGVKPIRFLAAAVAITLFSGCRQSPDPGILLAKLESDLVKGNFAGMEMLADSIKKLEPADIKTAVKADSLVEIARRTEIDFPVPEEVFRAQLKEKTGGFSESEFESWEKNRWLEWKLINGEKKYFRRAASNLILLRNHRYSRAIADSVNSLSEEIHFRRKHIGSVINASRESGKPVMPVEMTVNYTLTVKPDAVPEGKIIRCWLPYPKENHLRQQKVKLISASHENFIVAPDSATHRTIYMEQKAVKNQSATFKVSFCFESSAVYFDPAGTEILPYDINSKIVKTYTSEQLPHICFTEKVRQLADSITGSETKPFEILKKIYYWIDANIPWAGALEYSTIPNIPEYVLTNRRGDCGMQTFLLMSMLRYKGIPVRWQSGWMMPPGNENLHDWCEVYFEGSGWIPVDMSYGLQYSDNKSIREFYVTGIDSYRMILNDGVAGKLYPEKQFLRSEPYDFQRGEVEWEGGNLYFDKWSYDIGIEYQDKSIAIKDKKPELQLIHY